MSANSPAAIASVGGCHRLVRPVTAKAGDLFSDLVHSPVGVLGHWRQDLPFDPVTPLGAHRFVGPGHGRRRSKEPDGRLPGRRGEHAIDGDGASLLVARRDDLQARVVSSP